MYKLPDVISRLQILTFLYSSTNTLEGHGLSEITMNTSAPIPSQFLGPWSCVSSKVLASYNSRIRHEWNRFTKKHIRKTKG